jgi:haloalkane dehalogenase
VVSDQLRALYPFESHHLDVGDGERGDARMHYLDEGEGEPVLMVHGNPSWSFYYRDLALALRGTHRVVVPDHIGCGLSDKPGDDAYEYTLSRRVDDLERLTEHLGIDEGVNLVVHDWGGMIGFAWAARRPARVKRLVVLNTAAFHLPAGKAIPWQLRLSRSPGLGATLIRGFNAFARGATKDCVTRKPMTPGVRAGFLHPYDSWANRIAVLRFVEDIPLAPGDRAWDTVSATEAKLEGLRGLPMLICWGMNDFVFDGDYLAEWERRFPDADVHRFDDCGHYVLEDAGDEIAGLVQRFLAT